ncbi:hypothetical protein JCM1841_000583 [Sporobolomyces salmonicolor]
MPSRSPSPPPRRRSPSPATHARTRSPPPRSTLDDDRHSSRRRSRYDDDRGDRYGERGGDRDRERDGRGRGGGYDRRGDDYASSRRRSRSPDRRPSGPRVDSGKGREKEGGDGGWGKKGASPGGPSQALPSQQSLLARDGEEGDQTRPKSVEPNFAQSGALAAETNTLRGVVLKYNEPPEARKPVRNWRLYVFKGKEQVELFHVHRQSAYLFGRDRIVADIPVDHPSTSKQHAVLQFRQVVERNEFGDTKSLTKPFLIDLDSANGTMVNDETVPPSRFYELKSGDVLKFAFSTREYVLLVET